MGPKKKKNPKNDFFFFMQDYKKVLQRQGRSWRDMRELADICGPPFAQISEGERQRYKNMAKEWKEQEKGNLSNKFNHLGVSLQDIKDQETARKKYLGFMKHKIEETVKGNMEDGTLVKQKFYFIHFNTLCTTNEDKHLPCEVALIEYSLQGGVSRYLQNFIYPPNIPVGYSYTMKCVASDTHLITLDCEPMQHKASKDHSWLVRKILTMICETGDTKNMPPLYTLPNEEEKTRSILEDLFHWGGYGSPESKNLFIFHMDELYFQLSNTLPPDFNLPTKLLALSKLEEERFIYSLDVACDYHDQKDRTQYCSLFAVKKLAFIISDHCCKSFDIGLIPGKHIPPGETSSSDLPREEPQKVVVDFEGVNKIYKEKDADADLNGFKSTTNPAGMSFVGDLQPKWEEAKPQDFHGETPSDLPRKRESEYKPVTQTDPTFQENEFPNLGPASTYHPGPSNTWGRREDNGNTSNPPPGFSTLTNNDDFPTLGASRGQPQGRGSSRGNRGRRGLSGQMNRMKL